jgi:hypothetical protein
VNENCFWKSPEGGRGEGTDREGPSGRVPNPLPFSSGPQLHHRARNLDRPVIPSGIFLKANQRGQSPMAKSAHTQWESRRLCHPGASDGRSLVPLVRRWTPSGKRRALAISTLAEFSETRRNRGMVSNNEREMHLEPSRPRLSGMCQREEAFDSPCLSGR